MVNSFPGMAVGYPGNKLAPLSPLSLVALFEGGAIEKAQALLPEPIKIRFRY